MEHSEGEKQPEINQTDETKERNRADHLEQYKWGPGKSGNPKGRPPNAVPAGLRKLTQETYAQVIELVLTGNLDELQAMVKDPKTPAVQVGIATAFIKAIKEGNYQVMERIAERIVGKLPENINIQGNFHTSVVDYLDSVAKARKVDEQKLGLTKDAESEDLPEGYDDV